MDGVCRDLAYVGIFHPKWKASCFTLCLSTEKTSVSRTPLNVGGSMVTYLSVCSTVQLDNIKCSLGTSTKSHSASWEKSMRSWNLGAGAHIACQPFLNPWYILTHLILITAHRFYAEQAFELKHDMWLSSPLLSIIMLYCFHFQSCQLILETAVSRWCPFLISSIIIPVFFNQWSEW